MEHPKIYKFSAQAAAISVLKSDHAAVKDWFMQFNLLVKNASPTHQKSQ